MLCQENAEGKVVEVVHPSSAGFRRFHIVVPVVRLMIRIRLGLVFRLDAAVSRTGLRFTECTGLTFYIVD